MPVRTTAQPPTTRIQFSEATPQSVTTDALILCVPTGGADWSAPLATVDTAMSGLLRQALDDAGYRARKGAATVIPTLGRLPARRIVATGLAAGDASPEDIRQAYGAAATAARRAGATDMACALPSEIADAGMYLRAAVEGALLALYDFGQYKSGSDDDATTVETVTFLCAESDAARAGVAAGFAVAAGVYLARDLVNEPGHTLYPETFAAIASTVARDNELEYQEYDEQQLAEMGATAIVDVGKGSVHPPRMMHLTYRPSGESRGTIAFVGKGITFDTGGMNLKPTGGIETMKTDMAGAAAVLGAMRTVAALDLPFTVLGIIASAENMPSATAFRPGDVVTALNGKTMEIISTDAEGRLVLSDALVYAARNGAEEMIDLATLTGAKMVALGAESVAVFSNDDAFAQRVVAAGSAAGDLFWHMPLWGALRKQISSDIADMKNSGGRPGGAITAALLLSEFTEGVPWVHLDIAGAAWADAARPYTPKGPTGIGVRALVTYLEAKITEGAPR